MKFTQGLQETFKIIKNNECCDTEGLTEVINFCKEHTEQFIEQFSEEDSNCTSFIIKGIKFRGQVGEAHFSFVRKPAKDDYAIDRIDAEIFTLGLEKGTSNYAYKVTIASEESATCDLRRTKKYLVTSTRTKIGYHQRPEKPIRKYVIESINSTGANNKYNNLSLISVYDEGTTIRRLMPEESTSDDSFNSLDDISSIDTNE